MKRFLATLLVTAPLAAQQLPVTFTGEPELVSPGVISTAKPEIRIAHSPDGKRRVWGTIGWEGGAGGWDIWESIRQEKGWSAPRPVSFNSSYKDFDPSFAPDGSGIYFFSNRPGGEGGDDIYFVPRDSEGRYGVPRNLGRNVNSSGDEWAPLVSADGSRLLFASDGRGGKGLHDLFISTLVEGKWAEAVALSEVSSAVDDFDATWLHDGKTIVFSRKEKEKDEMYLFATTLRGEHYTVPVRLGPQVNTDKGWSLGPSIDPSEGGVLYFTSQRPGRSAGMLDIYRIRYSVPE